MTIYYQTLTVCWGLIKDRQQSESCLYFLSWNNYKIEKYRHELTQTSRKEEIDYDKSNKTVWDRDINRLE